MQKIRILLIVLLMGSTALPGWAGEYTAATVTALQNALTLAQGNGADDTITIEPGIYNVTTPLTYTPNENQALTLHGGEGGITTLDGGGAVQILKIDTSGLPDDANANIQILYINFQKGKSQSVGGAGLSVKTSTASILVEGCVFQENIGNGQGGGGLHISATDGRIDIIHSIFTTNSGPIIGGGAYLESVKYRRSHSQQPFYRKRVYPIRRRGIRGIEHRRRHSCQQHRQREFIQETAGASGPPPPPEK